MFTSEVIQYISCIKIISKLFIAADFDFLLQTFQQNEFSNIAIILIVLNVGNFRLVSNGYLNFL